MSNFVTKAVTSIKGKQQFRQLITLVGEDKPSAELQDQIDKNEIDIDGCLDDYEQSLEVKYQSSFRGLVAIMNRVANLQPVTEHQFKDVTPHGELVKEFEFKYQDLRAYAIKIPNGKLIILGGFKNQQKKDYSRFRSLKKQFLDCIKI